MRSNISHYMKRGWGEGELKSLKKKLYCHLYKKVPGHTHDVMHFRAAKIKLLTVWSKILFGPTCICFSITCHILQCTVKITLKDCKIKVLKKCHTGEKSDRVKTHTQLCFHTTAPTNMYNGMQVSLTEIILRFIANLLLVSINLGFQWVGFSKILLTTKYLARSTS